MNELLEGPAWFAAGAFVAGVIFTFGKWVGRVNANEESLDEFKETFEAFEKEVRDDITEIRDRLPKAKEEK